MKTHTHNKWVLLGKDNRVLGFFRLKGTIINSGIQKKAEKWEKTRIVTMEEYEEIKK